MTGLTWQTHTQPNRKETWETQVGGLFEKTSWQLESLLAHVRDSLTSRFESLRVRNATSSVAWGGALVTADAHAYGPRSRGPMAKEGA